MSLLLALIGGGSTVNGVGSSTGVGNAQGIASVLFNGIGSSTGLGLAQAIGSSSFSSLGSSIGIGSALGVSKSLSNGAGTANGIGIVLGIGVALISGVGLASGSAIALGVGTSGAVITYAKLPRLPIDPYLPINDDEQQIIRRVSEVYSQIAIFYNTMTYSTTGTFEQLPVYQYLPGTVQQLVLIWNELNKRITISYNNLAITVIGSQGMSYTSFPATSDNIGSFKVNFYDQYRRIYASFNNLAYLIDTANGY